MHSMIPYHALKAHYASLYHVIQQITMCYDNVICNVSLKPDQAMNCTCSLILTLIVISCQRAKFSNMDNHGPTQKKKQNQKWAIKYHLTHDIKNETKYKMYLFKSIFQIYDPQDW